MKSLSIILYFTLTCQLLAQQQGEGPNIDAILQRAADRWESVDTWSFEHTYKYIDVDYTDTLRITSDVLLIKNDSVSYGYNVYAVFRENECMIFDGKQLIHGLLTSDTFTVASDTNISIFLENSFARNVRFPSFSKKRNWVSMINTNDLISKKLKIVNLENEQHYQVTLESRPNEKFLVARRELLVRCRDSLLVSNSEYIKRMDERDTVDQRRITEIRRIVTGDGVDPEQFYMRYNLYSKILRQEDTSVITARVSSLLGKDAPRYVLYDNNNVRTVIPALGKICVIDFWYEQCPPCGRFLKNLPMLIDSVDKSQVEIQLVNVEDRPRIDRLTKKHEILADLGILLKGESNIIDGYGITTYPTIVVVDERGKVVSVEYGYGEDTIPSILRVIHSLQKGSQQ